MDSPERPSVFDRPGEPIGDLGLRLHFSLLRDSVAEMKRARAELWRAVALLVGVLAVVEASVLIVIVLLLTRGR